MNKNYDFMKLTTIVLSFVFSMTIFSQQNTNTLKQQREKFEGIWLIDGIGSEMYFNVIKITVVDINQLKITVEKNNTDAVANGGNIHFVSFNGTNLVIRIVGNRYWAAKGNINLKYEEKWDNNDGRYYKNFSRIWEPNSDFPEQMYIGNRRSS